jgi:hypothetical protein
MIAGREEKGKQFGDCHAVAPIDFLKTTTIDKYSSLRFQLPQMAVPWFSHAILNIAQTTLFLRLRLEMISSLN